MKKTILFIAIILFVILVVFQITYRGNKPMNNYCLKIDTLIQSYKLGYSDEGIISELEKSSGMEATCNKGTYGYIYYDDVSFDADIKRWKKYFKCK